MLISVNAKSAISLKDICYGTGFVMHEGAMVATGGCALKHNNSKGTEEDPLNVGDGSNNITNSCELKEGDVYIKLRRFFGNIAMRPMTPIERLSNYNTIGEHNTSALGAADYVPPEPAAFLQKSKQDSSQADLPH